MCIQGPRATGGETHERGCASSRLSGAGRRTSSARLDLFSRELMKPSALGDKFAQQAVGILVRPPLPGALRVGKIDVHRRLVRIPCGNPRVGKKVSDTFSFLP